MYKKIVITKNLRTNSWFCKIDNRVHAYLFVDGKYMWIHQNKEKDNWKSYRCFVEEIKKQFVLYNIKKGTDDMGWPYTKFKMKKKGK